MKKFICFILTLTVLLFSACKKNSNDNNTGWSDEDKTGYKNVMTLQKQASANYATWSQSMDSLEAINKLAQFFRDDPLVSSATIGSQGITVMFKNGMGGGIFLNPEDEPGNGKLKCGSFTNEGHVPLNNKSIVNKKDMILLNPTYWERSEYIDPLVVNYEKNLPKVGMRLAKTYFNEWADVEQFIKLSGYGIIQIYTHGWAWPDNREISDIYIQTGEVENEETSNIYWKEIRTKDVLIAEAGTAYGREFVYLLSQKFLADHNDFSQDTILFNGSFCYSGLGNWPNLQKSFAAGTYIGIDWSVYTSWCVAWAKDLVSCLTDTLLSIPVTTSNWLSLWAPPNPQKQYYDKEEGKYVSLKIYGDSSLALWGGVKDIDGNVYHTVTIGSQVWMVENLKTSRLNDGTHIPSSFTDDEWKNLTTAAACYYDFSSTALSTYGSTSGMSFFTHFLIGM